MAGGSNPRRVAAPTPSGVPSTMGGPRGPVPFGPKLGKGPDGKPIYATPSTMNLPQASTPIAAAPAQPNVFQQSADAYTQALQGTAGSAGMPNIEAFQNPYTQQVIDTSMADLERQRLMQQNQLGAQASAVGAFGGSRQGIAEAETNRAFAEQGGQLAAQLRQQGFNTALQAAQGQQGQQLAAAGQFGNLSQTGFNMGQSITQQQMQQGAMQQAINQALIDAARNQYAGFTGAPGQSLSATLAALGGANMGQQTQTTTQQPGLFNYLSLGLGAL